MQNYGGTGYAAFAKERHMPLAKQNNKYTFQDYLTWPDEERWEIIDGDAFNMTPAPGSKHQLIAGSFYRILGNQLVGKSCTAFIAPTDVVLSDYNVVQPDVFVVCDKKKITDANIQGAPDLVIEVLSPSTSLKDKREKKTLYEKFGVKEYIIIAPLEKYAERTLLEDGRYARPEIFGPRDTLVLRSLEDVEIKLVEVFGADATPGK